MQEPEIALKCSNICDFSDAWATDIDNTPFVLQIPQISIHVIERRNDSLSCTMTCDWWIVWPVQLLNRFVFLLYSQPECIFCSSNCFGWDHRDNPFFHKSSLWLSMLSIHEIWDSVISEFGVHIPTVVRNSMESVMPFQSQSMLFSFMSICSSKQFTSFWMVSVLTFSAFFLYRTMWYQRAPWLCEG
jgi:hypothetical protein